MTQCLECKEWVHDCDCGDSEHCGDGYYPIFDKETNTEIGMVHAECIEAYNTKSRIGGLRNE